MVYQIVWEFLPAPGCRAEFEGAYGAEGAWARLFSRGRGYIGTEFRRPERAGDWYRTIDRWESRDAYDAFRVAYAADYEALDALCEGLTLHERHVATEAEP
jgi:heme-degrading monooxygenase HmoA